MSAQSQLAPLPVSDARARAVHRGLSSAEAERRLAEDGPNDPSPPKERSELAELALLLANPLVVILVVASAISAFLGEVANALIVTVIVVISVVLNFVQTFRSQRALERLRAQVAPTATVLRDGRFVELRRDRVVRGDIVRVSAGDLVPADARLLDARDLHVQEAALTGESMPVAKEATTNGRSTTVFLGTSVVSGTATAVVTATGRRTAFGDIASRLATRPQESEFDRGLRDFGLLITRAVFFLVLFIVVVRVALHRGAFESLLFAVALAVGLTPEFLPMITTVTLGKAALRMADKKVLVKHLSAIQNLGSIDVLCSDKTGTVTAGTMRLVRSIDPRGEQSDAPRVLAWVNSRFETGIRSPLDAAILAEDEPLARGYEKIDEVPFDFDRRRLSIVARRGDERILVTKGAPESIELVSARYRRGDRILALDAEARARCASTVDALSRDGLRVLAVAHRSVPDDQAEFTADDERDLVLDGFLAFSDPPLADAALTIAALARDGVAVKILTGDDERVARHVCREVGLAASEIVLGDDIDGMDAAALAHVAERATVFARVSPAQKHRILVALRVRSHVVGFMGDGINDAPSLHAADVGISFATAVDVARDTADLVLLDRKLSVVHDGILEGRRAFGNVTKYVLMGTSSNFGNMFSMAAASLVLPFLPMLPVQILLNNLLYDLAQITIPTDHVDEEYLRAPRRWDVATIRNFMVAMGPVSSIYDFLTFYALFAVFHAGQTLFHTGWFVESLATQTLVIFVIRTRGAPMASRPSAALTATVIAVVAFACALPYVPLLRDLLGFEPLPASFFLFLGAVVTTYLALAEAVKQRLLNRSAPRLRRRPACT